MRVGQYVIIRETSYYTDSQRALTGLIRHGSPPTVGSIGKITAKVSGRGYWMVEYKNLTKGSMYGPKVCLGFHESSLEPGKFVAPRNPKITYRVHKSRNKGSIRVGEVWITPKDDPKL